VAVRTFTDARPKNQLLARTFIAQMILTSACRATHQVSQRCADSLLMTHDRMKRQDFRLSHRVLADMLDARRPTVTAATIALQSAGISRYRRGRSPSSSVGASRVLHANATQFFERTSAGCVHKDLRTGSLLAFDERVLHDVEALAEGRFSRARMTAPLTRHAPKEMLAMPRSCLGRDTLSTRSTPKQPDRG
jgi:hypothetical protein